MCVGVVLVAAACMAYVMTRPAKKTAEFRLDQSATRRLHTSNIRLMSVTKNESGLLDAWLAYHSRIWDRKHHCV
jgi:hypothetical protein